jgi:vacuolar protein sorting-associated protein 8
MSSDSEESHSSAHSNNQDHVAQVHEDRELSVGQDQDLAPEDSVNSDHDQGGAEEEEAEELESIDSGGNGLTFARVRSRGAQQPDDETTSELSFRPKIERPGSPESTSVPDDTPSIQVRVETWLPNHH